MPSSKLSSVLGPPSVRMTSLRLLTGQVWLVLKASILGRVPTLFGDSVALHRLMRGYQSQVNPDEGPDGRVAPYCQASTRALHSRPELWIGEQGSCPCFLARRGCVIPWRRPSWVRIPPPALLPLSSGVESQILQHAWHLKKEGYRESTITARVKALRGLARKS